MITADDYSLRNATKKIKKRHHQVKHVLERLKKKESFELNGMITLKNEISTKTKWKWNLLYNIM